MRRRVQLQQPHGREEDETDNGALKQELQVGGGWINGWRMFVAVLIFRVASALACRTAFVPDEHWQSLEVAHRLVFGYPT